MTNREKFLNLVSDEKTDTIEINSERIKRRAMLKESQSIALKVLLRLDELDWSQKDLAKKMEVSPQQVNKIVSGKENLTLETQIKLQTILDIPILASYYDKPFKKIKEDVLTFLDKEKYSLEDKPQSETYDTCKIINMKVSPVDVTSMCQIAK